MTVTLNDPLSDEQPRSGERVGLSDGNTVALLARNTLYAIELTIR